MHHTYLKAMDAPRREFIAKMAFAAAGIVTGVKPIETIAATSSSLPLATSQKAASPVKVCIFSKHMHWLGYEEMARTAAEIGFDGIDLTVRPNGHVLPENVVTDLPKAVSAARKAGLDVPMITTDITSAQQPHAGRVLETASKLGVKYYRTGWLPYSEEVSVPETLEKYKLQLKALADLNKKHRIHGAYQNHAGTDVGAAVWDLWYLIKERDPQWMGLQYDIKHATLEGGQSWLLDVRLMHEYMKTMDIKDFLWVKKDDKWQAQLVPLGEGMVNFPKFFSLLKQHQVSGPMSLHLEYPLGGAESGAKQLSVKPAVVIEAMRKDLLTLRAWLKEADL